METVLSLASADELRQLVKSTLCEHDHLDPEQIQMYEAPLKRAGQACGLLFEIHGPRLLRSSAIWVKEERRVLFYDSTGLRFAEIRLLESPALPELIAA